MASSPTISPSRLILARQRRRLTVTALAQKLEVTPRTVSRWESGSVAPPESMLRLAAHILGFPVSFFYGNPLEDLPIDAVSFRALSKTSAGLRDSSISAGRIAVELARWLDDMFTLPNANVPTFPGYDPEVAAASVRERWGLGVSPINNIVDLLESRGVKVFSLASDVREVDAFSFFWGKTPFALVNTGKTGERQRFDLAHELGHLVLHCEHKATSSRDAEQEAHRFAAALLMPREDVTAQPLWYADIQRIIKYKKRWRVSAMALTHRLRELKMLTEWGYRDACVLLSRAGYRSAEPHQPIVPETSQILSKVFKSLRDSGMTSAAIAAQLHLDPSELGLYVFGLVPTAMAGGGQGGGPVGQLQIVADNLTTSASSLASQQASPEETAVAHQVIDFDAARRGR